MGSLSHTLVPQDAYASRQANFLTLYFTQGKPNRTLTEPVPEKQPDAICPGHNSELSHGKKCTCAVQNEGEKFLQRAKLRLILSTIEKMEFDLKRSQERSKQEDELFQLDKMKKEIEVELCRLQVIKMKRDLDF